MSPRPSDDKRVGDETLQRIDDLAGGWTLPGRAKREEAEAPGTDRPAGARQARGTPSQGASPGEPPDRDRGGKRKVVAREKTRAAKGKERGKAAAVKRAPADMPIPTLLRSGRGTEQPPEPQEGVPRPARLVERRPDSVDDSGAGLVGAPAAPSNEDGPGREVDDAAAREAGGDGADQAATREVGREIANRIVRRSMGGDNEDRPVTRAVASRTGSAERAARRALADRQESADRAAARAIHGRGDDVELDDHAATAVAGARERAAEDGAKPAPSSDHAATSIFGRKGGVDGNGSKPADDGARPAPPDHAATSLFNRKRGADGKSAGGARPTPSDHAATSIFGRKRAAEGTPGSERSGDGQAVPAASDHAATAIVGARSAHEDPTRPIASAREGSTRARPSLQEEPTTRGSATGWPADDSDDGASFDHAATAILGAPPERDDPTAPSSSATDADQAPAIEASSPRDTEETMLQPPGSGVYTLPGPLEARKGSATAVLRLPPTLPRRRGALGDLLYLYTAAVGSGRARRELTAAGRKLDAEKQARGRRLADLARLALADTALDDDVITAGREEVMDLEDRRSRCAGAAAGADAEISALEREREDEQKANGLARQVLRRTGTETDEKLEPLQRLLQAARRRAMRLQASLVDLDRRLTRLDERLTDMTADQRATADANLASLRAEREAMAREVPEAAEEIDDLEPAIASLVAARADGRAAEARIEERERDGVARTAEKIAAVSARRVVDERAEAELAQDQEDALRALGERLAVDRPAELTSRLRGIDEHEVAIATLERRHLELSELVRSVDRWALVRGFLWLTVIAFGLATALVWSTVLPFT
ncbi:MAG TPA: hypothetical protein VK698_12540 [Kofleriaceae bacterium]|nr:hypothetical protein [Kofleriaceae bacterium]